MIGHIIAKKYRIVERIGTGGMADVYKALQITSPHRAVAVKVLKSEFAQDAAFLRRFDQEAQAVLGLSHENIVQPHDVGSEQDLHYIVLEYVEGDTLKDRIRERGSISARTAVNMGAQLLDALGHAHEKGIIHRDVKPQNIIINSKGRVKLTDFGIARNTAAENTQTFTGSSVLGSVHYLSPEQARGNAVTLESDIYSTGATLYEMVTGRVPFDNDNSVSIALMHLQEEAVPAIEVNPAVPPALNDIIIKAMQKDPALRYHSAKEMRRDLLRVLKEPAGDYAKLAASPAAKPAKKRRRKRGVFRVVLVTFVLLGLFLVLLLSGQSLLHRGENSADSTLVPQLVGKLQDEAMSIALLRGYTASVSESRYNDEAPAGEVIFQSPDAGTPLNIGGVVSIVVSLGSGEETYMPDLIGKTLAEAEELLSEVGLIAATPEYRESTLPAGQIFEQAPKSETQLYRGDSVQLYISGAPLRSVEVPDVLARTLGDALVLLSERGFTQFYVRREQDANVPFPQIARQDPAPNEMGNPDGITSLVLAASEPATYMAKVTSTIDVPSDGAHLTILAPREEQGISYMLVLHEQALSAGDAQALAFEFVMDYSGTQQLIFMLDNVEIAQTSALFLRAEDL